MYLIIIPFIYVHVASMYITPDLHINDTVIIYPPTASGGTLQDP